MPFGMIDSLFNALIFLFWFRIWFQPGERPFAVNPYLNRAGYYADSLIRFLRPVCFGLPATLISLVAVCFLLAFRAVMLPATVHWSLRVGFEYAQARPDNLAECLFMSFLSFLLFLFNLWALTLIYAWNDRAATFRRTSKTLFILSRPLTGIPQSIRPVALLVLGTLLAAGARTIALGGSIPAWTPAVITQLGLSALTAWVNVIPLLQQFVIALIVGSWVSTFGGSSDLLSVCREWLDLLLGPVRRFPLRIGMLDLTPLIFLFGLGALYLFLMSLLAGLYNPLS